MLDELVHHWSQQPPPMFTPSAPTLQALSYYPFRIVAAEWVNYIAVLGLSLREYELSTSPTSDLVAELEKLNTDLRILQGWRRRILSTQAKLRRNIRFIRSHSDPLKPSEDWDDLMEDYEFISTEVVEHGNRLEAMVPLVTSAASLIESRRSLTETANVTRLTILAVVFIPLSYVAALFSMAEEFGPSGSQFWIYFATAVPLAVVVGLIAKPPVTFARKVWDRVRVSAAK
jgi:Mg2+ and Co2+ transporter CorA